MSWEERHIGKRWTKQVDCYERAKLIIKEELGIDMPTVSGLSKFGRAKCLLRFEQQHCNKVSDFKPLDLVLMRLVGSEIEEHHIGVWSDVDGGGVVHSMENSSTIFQSLTGLKATGWVIARVIRIKIITKHQKSRGVTK